MTITLLNTIKKMSEFFEDLGERSDNKKIQILDLIEEKKKRNEEKIKLQKEINNVQNKINHIDKMIYFMCNHEWVIDRTNYGEHTEYYCNKCSFYKD